MSREVAAKGAEEGKKARGDVLGWRKVRGKGKIGVECPEGLRKLEQTRHRRRMVQVASEGKKVADEWVCHFCIVGAKVPGLVDGDDSLVRFERPKVVTYQVMSEIVLGMTCLKNRKWKRNKE